MSRRKNQVTDQEFEHAYKLIVGKATRYQLTKVEVSDRLVVGFSADQLAKLVQDVADAGFTVEFKNQTGYADDIAHQVRQVQRFGSEPTQRGRHPKSVDWANG